MTSSLETLLASRISGPSLNLSPMLTIWQISMEKPAAPECYEPVLNVEERRRADAFGLSDLRRRHVWCRLGLRQLLGDRLGCAPGDLVLQSAPNGRPFVAGYKLDFNLSHSADIALVALLDGGGQVGVDVEALTPRADMGRLARKVFTEQEIVEQADAGVDALEAFYRCWTCKEAYLKALGTGLRTDPRSVSLSFGPGGAVTVVESPLDRDCRLVSFSPQPGFMAAVAIHTGVPR